VDAIGPFLLGVLAAVAIQLLVEALTGAISPKLRRIRGFVRRPSPSYAAESDELFALHQWTITHKLQRGDLISQHLDVQERPTQRWIDEAIWRGAVTAEARGQGELCYLVRLEPDHREGPANQVCRVWFASSEYAEAAAVMSLRSDKPESLRTADRVIADDPVRFLAGAVPTSLNVNAVVVAENHLLCMRRSNAVGSARGMWTVGAVEAMKRSPDPGRAEDLFSLTERALEEELGLYVVDGESTPYLTWIGLYRPVLRGHLVAVIDTTLDRATIEQRRTRSDSYYEHDMIRWLPLGRRTLVRFLQAQAAPDPRDVHPALEVFPGERWVNHARLAVHEAWRFSPVLESS
jgi:hypothetical protein